jgi:hypothetical protein
MLRGPRIAAAAFCCAAFGAQAHAPYAPGVADASEGYRVMDWRMPGVQRVITQGWVDTLGISFVWPRPEQAEVKQIDGRSCLVGGFFAFDIADELAFDVDETIELELELEAATTPALLIDYDHNGKTMPPRQFAIDSAGSRWHTEVIALPRARLANLGQYGTDIAIAAPGAGVTADPEVAFNPDLPHSMTLCSVKLRRSNTTPAKPAPGWVEISTRDAAGAPTPARLGLYDQDGRTPLPAESAVPVQRYGDLVRLVRLRFGGPSSTETWFHDNRWVFLGNGAYRAQIPAGNYELVISKGPEYRVERRTFALQAGATQSLEVPLQRWSDAAADGWISGDDHAHMTREPQHNDDILTLAQAEDVRVLNLLRMGNIHETTFEQYAYGEAGIARRGEYALVPGQEDPRSGQRGHTLHLNIRQPVRVEDYFAYHKVFEEMRRQGAVSGYAHVGEGHFNDRRGIALEAPFGLVDIAEILQFGVMNLGTWYEFLNLGFRINPSAGADWPYGSLPGSERVYVQTGGSTELGAWYEGLRHGNSFVSNGPLLEFSVNGKPPGSVLEPARGATLKVVASARQNPDFDRLDRLELVRNGEVVASVAGDDMQALNLEHELVAGHGMWLAVRAWGRGYTKAHSAPVYIGVEGEPSWNRAEVPALAAKMRASIRSLVEQPANALLELEYWSTHEAIESRWPGNCRRCANASMPPNASIASWSKRRSTSIDYRCHDGRGTMAPVTIPRSDTRC